MDERVMEEGCKGPSMTVIVDSGADASLFPGFMRELGEEATGCTSYLQDAQGTKIKTYGSKDVDIILWSTEGRQVILTEKVTFSDNPLIWKAHEEWMVPGCKLNVFDTWGAGSAVDVSEPKPCG